MASKLQQGARLDTSMAPTQESVNLDPSSWVMSWGRGRIRLYLVALQAMGEGVICALAILLAFLMYQSWPESLGQVHKTPLTLFPLFYQVLRSPEFASFLPLFLLSPVIHLLIFHWLQLYRPNIGDTRPFGATWTIFKGALTGTAILLMLAHAYQTTQSASTVRSFPSLFFMYQNALVFFGVLIYHAATLILLLCLRAFGIARTRVAVVYHDQRPNALYHALQSPTSEYNLIGEIPLQDKHTKKNPSNISAPLGALDSLKKLINTHNLDEIILALDPGVLSTDQRLDVAQTCWQMGAALKMLTPFQPFFRTSARPEQIGDVSLLHVQNLGLYATWPQILKRAMDIAASFTALMLLSPIMILFAILIKLDSPGPIFFVQERVGLNGRIFRMFKFRSMRSDADSKANVEKHKAYVQQLIQGDKEHEVDEDGNPIYKITNDPRITKLGHFIRKTSIDELPQLFNALRGDMSLVGPRPPIQYEVDEYKDWHNKRLLIRPGITGLWQVSGRNRLSFDEMVKLDIMYIEQWSLWFDIKILLKTIPVILKIDQSF